MPGHLSRQLRLAAVSIAIAMPVAASAALGGDASSVDADRVQMRGALLRIARLDPYTLHEVQTSSGTNVREYVSTGGTVFAVAWDGPWQPDLRQLLGAYFDRYEQAAQQARAARRSHGPLSIQLPELIVQVGGHARAFHGRAYLPGLLPQTVQLDAIR